MLYDEITQLNLQINYTKKSIEHISKRIYRTKDEIEYEKNKKNKENLEKRLNKDNITRKILQTKLIEITMKIKELERKLYGIEQEENPIEIVRKRGT